MYRWLSENFFALTGWEPVIELPDAQHFIILGVPHTSNWDFLFTIAIAPLLDLEFRWIGKHTLFRPPFGRVMRWLGGLPVDRRHRHDSVRQIAEFIKSRPHVALVIAPEGTRSRARHWKSGFYHIAREARVPVVLGFLDYEKKRVGLGPAIWPTDDPAEMMERIRAFYSDKVGLHPQNFGPVRLRSEDALT